jgi:NADPH-dependent 7-cyano-7-deazaguanine reductase QueF
VFEENHQSMILVRDIELYSLCEHHLLPFFGRAHVAYIPDRRIVGLSKIPRIVEVFARRLQVQERLSDQIADAIMDIIQPHGVGVLIEATHLCMAMRGVEKQNSRTVTSAVRGIFRSDLRSRGVPPPGAWTSVRMSGLAGRFGRGDRCLPGHRTRRRRSARDGGATVVRLARSLKDGARNRFHDVACDLTKAVEVVRAEHPHPG